MISRTFEINGKKVARINFLILRKEFPTRRLVSELNHTLIKLTQWFRD